MLNQTDAALLIGDPALRIAVAIEKHARPGTQGQAVCQAATLGITSSELLYVYDVVGEWRNLTGLPAVLAVWASRREIATPELTADFLASREIGDRKSTRLNSSHGYISYAVFCLKKKKNHTTTNKTNSSLIIHINIILLNLRLTTTITHAYRILIIHKEITFITSLSTHLTACNQF